MKYQMNAKGFTLIELLVTVTIVAILSVIALPMAELVAQRGKEQQLRAALWQIRGAIDQYKQATDDGRIAKDAGESGYPHNLEDLAQGAADIKDPKKPIIYFLRRVPRNPLVNDASIPASQTWGKRSYESSPDEPSEGEDVYDVYPLSEKVGLNGIPYKEW